MVPACEEEGTCTEELVSRIHAGFYVRDAGNERDTTLEYITFYGILRPDSLLYDSSPSRKELVFPLPAEPLDFSGFVLSNTIDKDTIYIRHIPGLKLVSYACGFTLTHDIEELRYGNNIIDTIVIQNPRVETSDEENLKIYFWPAVAPDTAR